jgi:streptogramin lyase
MWFTEATGNKIGRITTAGAVTEYPIPTAASQPNGIVTGSDGNLWFTETSANKIGRLVPSTGAITEFTIPTANSQPMGITLGPDGDVFFAEYNANKIGRITPAGAIAEFSTLFAPPPADHPLYVTPGRQSDASGLGAIWYSAEGSGRIGYLSPDGALAGETSAATPTDYSNGVAATGITAGADGNMWWIVNDPSASNGSVLEDFTGLFGSQTQTQPAQAGAFALTSQLLADPENGYWYVDDTGTMIGLQRVSGDTRAVTDFAVPATHGTSCFVANSVRSCPLTGLAFGPDQAVWFTDFANNAIARFPTSYAPVPAPVTGATGATGSAGQNAPTIIVIVPFGTAVSKHSVRTNFAITGPATVSLSVRSTKSKAKATTVAVTQARRAGRGCLAWNRKLGRKPASRGSYVLTLTATAGGSRATATVRVRLK